MDATTRRLLIAAQVCYGIFPVVGKIALGGFEPRAVVVWRLAVGSIALFALAVWKHGRKVWPSRRDLLQLFGLSILGVIINQNLFVEGLKRTTAVNAGLLITVIPVATLAIAVALRREVLTRRRTAGMLLSVFGVIWLFVSRDAALGGERLQGDVFITLNAISYSFYLVLAKPVLMRLPQLVVIAWVFIFGLIFVPWFSMGVPWVPAAATGRQWLALGAVLLFPTVLAYLLNTIVLARTHASTTAAWVMLQPFIATVLALLLLGEKPEGEVAITGVCVLLGLWLVSVGPRPHALVAPFSPGAPSSTDPPSGRSPPR